eukprot:scaffold2188_cov102-Isochrysis_galbana.AAC.8
MAGSGRRDRSISVKPRLYSWLPISSQWPWASGSVAVKGKGRSVGPIGPKCFLLATGKSQNGY